MRTQQFVLFLLLAVFAATTLAGNCSSRDREGVADSVKDVPLESYRSELLEIAFDAASAMPVFPHIKNRSRTQEAVVAACLSLDQPQRALRYIEQIDNWRRGAGYADLAFYCAQHGAMKEKIDPYVSKAAQLARETEDWRRDRIHVKIARAGSAIGPTGSFDSRLKDADALASAGSFDSLKSALTAYAGLYDRFYAGVERRALVEERMRSAWDNMPISIRVELLMVLAGSALDHEDRAKALVLAGEAGAMMDSARWQPRFGIPLRAKLAELSFRAGAQKQARTDVQEALSAFNEKREKIVNIYRAQILRSIAEAFQTMGDTDGARDLYGRALEAGIENPNSRPRAEDLTATCCSMAVYGVEPGPELSGRIRQVRDNLGDPW